MMEQKFESLVELWKERMKVEASRPWMKRMNGGDLKVAHYKGFLLETYHNTSYNPQLQAFATMYIRGNPRSVVKRFFQHATSEIAHDLLAFDDLVRLGIEENRIKSSRPLPTTTAFFANAVFNIQFQSPLTYLGYLFHLEFYATEGGGGILKILDKIGVPSEARSFITEHTKVDVGHLKLMATYVADLVKTDRDFDLISNSISDCVVLHTRMLEGAFENGEICFV